MIKYQEIGTYKRCSHVRTYIREYDSYQEAVNGACHGSIIQCVDIQSRFLVKTKITKEIIKKE